jgi:cell division protein FtsW (lipid II flippase)
MLVVMIAPRTVIARGIAVGAVAGMGMVAYVMSQLLGGLVVMARFLTLLERQTYLRSREGSLEAALYNAINFPFGAGMGRVGAAADKFKAELAQNPVPVRWSDTFPGQMISEAGVPALLFLSLILFLMVFHAFQAIRRTGGEIPRLTAIAIFSLLLTYIPFSVGGNPIMGNPYTAECWVLGGMAMKLSRAPRRENGA